MITEEDKNTMITEEDKNLSYLLDNLAAQLREGLSNLYLSGRRLAPVRARKASPSLDKSSAYADQSRIRMMRLVRNLEENAVLLRTETLTREIYDIVGLVSDICEESADLVAYLGVKLTFSCMEQCHTCAISPEHIRQLLYHLISNAMKHASKPGHVRVSLRFPRPPREILLSVEDDGNGIPEEELPMLFEWSRRPRGVKDFAHGMGLGLDICKRIAEKHGGTLSVESKPGKGSVFTMRIPDEPEKNILFRQPGFAEKNAGIHPSLLMLSDALPWEAFLIKNQL
ncbi:MAG: sensor histidine kinase [Oscillospiraceae bacterium]|nr:sensor histidine kinase [Oscillospiraceae bacterium]